MLHLENHAFARRQPFERGGNPAADFHALHTALRIGRRFGVLLAVKEIGGWRVAILVGRKFRGLIFRAAAPAAQMIEADIGYDSLGSGIEGALQTETPKIFVNFQERFLI